MRICEDALLDPASFDLSCPKRRSLQRKLRKARANGVEILQLAEIPWRDLARLDADWQAIHGKARGGTMGRFCPSYLKRQATFLAYQGGTPIAFASFARDQNRWSLDLIRHGRQLPDGTMHLIIFHALEAAQRQSVETVSLAAAPCPLLWLARLPHLQTHLANPGLRQFKQSFAPRWRPRYAVAKNPLALAIALSDIAAEVQAPRPLGNRPNPHNQDEDYEFALSLQP